MKGGAEQGEGERAAEEQVEREGSDKEHRQRRRREETGEGNVPLASLSLYRTVFPSVTQSSFLFKLFVFLHPSFKFHCTSNKME